MDSTEIQNKYNIILLHFNILRLKKTMSPKSIRVCVVGAGPSGLSVLYHVNKMKGCDSNIAYHDDNVNIDVVCYEKHSTMGGLWNMSWRVGKMMHQKITE